MEKNDYYSVYVGAYCLDNNLALQGLDTSLIPNIEIKEILDVAKGIKTDSNRITRGLLVGSLNPGLRHSMDALYQFAEESIRSRKIDEINEEYLEVRNKLKEEKQRQNFAKELASLSHLAAAGKIDEVNNKLWSIRYDEPTNIPDTRFAMVESIQETSGFQTGIKSIDDNTGGLSRSNLMSITGDSGHYKTMVSTWMVIKILETNPTYHACYFEKEMPVKDLAIRLVSYFMRVSQGTIKSFDDEGRSAFGDSLVEVICKDEKIADIVSRFHIIPNTAFDCASEMTDYIKHFRASVWCFDYLTMFQGSSSSDDAKNAHIEREIGVMKNIADRTNTLGIILGQLKQSTIEGRKNKIPLLQDIEYGKRLKNLAAYMFMTFMPKKYYDLDYVPEDYYYLIGVKNRFSDLFNIPLIANPSYCDFEEPVFDRQSMERWLSDYLKQFNSSKY